MRSEARYKVGSLVCKNIDDALYKAAGILDTCHSADMTAYRETLAEILEQVSGYEVFITEDGQEHYSKEDAEKHQVDLELRVALYENQICNDTCIEWLVKHKQVVKNYLESIYK